MSEKSDSQIRGQGESSAAKAKDRKIYEPPKLTEFGSVAKLTGQLKISGSADMVNFRPAS